MPKLRLEYLNRAWKLQSSWEGLYLPHYGRCCTNLVTTQERPASYPNSLPGPDENIHHKPTSSTFRSYMVSSNLNFLRLDWTEPETADRVHCVGGRRRPGSNARCWRVDSITP